MADRAVQYPWAKIYQLRQPLQINELGNVLDEIWAQHSNHRRSNRLDQPSARLVGDTEQIRSIREDIRKVAPSRATVLIRGESGTGKEVVAREIHRQSGRSGEFIAVNCGAIPDKLLESELFGHERGAFTDASARRIGEFERANGGTIFLDEIGDMPASMQVKLLRVLQERTIERVGGNESIAVDVRVLAATHRDLSALMAAEKFREDLFYRLNVFPIDLPPLRERMDDLPRLVEAFLGRLRDEHRVSISLSADAVEQLMSYSWPGNVRELVNVIERLSVLKTHGTVTARDLPPPLQSNGSGLPGEHESVQLVDTSLKQHLADIEIELIRTALDQSDGIVARAAELLRVGRTTLVEKMRRYDLTSDRDKPSRADQD
ncbi:MAG: sigma-54 dependent transcriptional regulator [Pseudomonadota bacterium]